MLAVTTIECPACGLAVPLGTSICPQDGTPLVPVGGTSAGEAAPRRDIPPRDEIPQGEDRQAVRTILRDPLIGATLGEYRVEERVGLGGMGLVYRGVHPMIGKSVAVKVLRPEICDSAAHVERLLAEARAVNAIRHRGIIDIFSFGKTPDGRQYLVMEFLDGIALDTYISERGMVVPSEAVSMLEEICAALAAAHGAGVIHRDLKPNNIFLVKPPYGARYTKILDFGLAKQGLPPGGTTPQTHFGLVVGTPEYMAPEQARGENVGPKTDLYSLGVVAFQMLTGHLPFDAKSPMEFVVKHLEHEPPLVIDVQPDVPKLVSDLVSRLLAKSPEDRPESADAVRKELRRIAKTLPHESTQGGVPAPVEPPVPLPAPGGRTAAEGGNGATTDPGDGSREPRAAPPPPALSPRPSGQRRAGPSAPPPPPPEALAIPEAPRAQEPTQRRPVPRPRSGVATTRTLTPRARNLLFVTVAGVVIAVAAGTAVLVRVRTAPPAAPATAAPPVAILGDPPAPPPPASGPAAEVPEVAEAEDPSIPDVLASDPVDPVKAKPPPRQAPPPPPPPPAPPREVITPESLISRANALQARYDALPTRSPIAPRMLDLVREEAPIARDQKRLKELSAILSRWERQYLAAAPP